MNLVHSNLSQHEQKSSKWGVYASVNGIVTDGDRIRIRILTKDLNSCNIGNTITTFYTMVSNAKILNLSNGKKIIVKDLVKTIFKVNNIKEWKIINKKDTPGDSFGNNASNKILKKKFNNYKFINLEDGLKKYFLWINKIKDKNLINSHPYKMNKNYKI